MRIWTTRCASVAVAHGYAATSTFKTGDALWLYLVGDISQDSGRLYLENQATGSKLGISPVEMPSGLGQLLQFHVPASWRGQPLRLTFAFDNTKPGSWMGFSEPVLAPKSHDAGLAFGICFRTSLYFFLLSLPLALTVLILVRRNWESQPILLLLGLCAVGAAGYLAFWFWFFHPRLGHAYDIAEPVVCAACLLALWRKCSLEQRLRLLATLRPWLLTLAIALFVLFAGFFYGGMQDPINLARIRFSHPLPADNELPFLLAEQLAHGKFSHPFFIDWLTSDRPPLQTGFTLLLYPFFVAPRALRYEVTSVLMQSLWVPALWSLLSLLGIRRRLVLLCLLALTFSEFVLLNSFFVWPKLLAAAFTIGGSALLLAVPRWPSRKQQFGVALAAGASLALGFLSHGGSAFAMPGLAAGLAIIRRRPAFRMLAMALVACIVVYLPWVAYQKLYDPPGDRLLKMHLAGVDDVDPRPLSEVLRSSYAALSWRQILEYRQANLVTVFDHQGEYWDSLRSFAASLPHDLIHEEKMGGAAAAALRTSQFFFVFPSLGLFMAGPLFLVAGVLRHFRTPTWRAGLFCWVYALCAILAWCALMFKPGSAVIHQGSYVIMFLAVCGSVLAYWNVSRSLAVTVVAAQSFLTAMIDIVYSRGVAPAGQLAEGIFHPASLILLAGSFLILLLWRTARAGKRPSLSHRPPSAEKPGVRAVGTALLLAVCLLFIARSAYSGQFTVPQIMSAPFSSGLLAAPRGSAAVWLQNDAGRRNLWIASGPAWQARPLTSFNEDDGQEIAEAVWAPDASYLLFTRGGDFENGGENPDPNLSPRKPDQSIWRIDVRGGTAAPAKLTEGQAPAISASGQIVFLRKGQIYELKNGEQKNGGEAEPLLEQKGTQSDLRWSPDGSRLAFVSQRTGHSFIGVFTLSDHSVRYLDPSIDRDSEPAWSPDGSSIAFLRQPTEGREAFFSPQRSGPPWSIRVIDLRSGAAREAFRAAAGPGSVFHPIDARQQIFWAGDRLVFPWERTGWLHLYTLPAAGGVPAELTPGTGEVEYVAPSRDGRTMFYSTNIGDIDRRHIARVAADGSSKPQVLSSGQGIEWQPTPVADASAVAYLASAYNQPAHPAVLPEGGAAKSIGPGPPPAFPATDLVRPQPVLLTAADGLQLHGQLFLPPGEGGRHPALIFFHGGSRRQMLLGYHYMYYYSNAYSLNQYLASHGFVVLSVNYRSGIGYGLDFREAIHYGAQGGSEYNDVMGAGLYLKSRADVDPQRIGVWGGSYGGYLTAMALARSSDLFAAGVDFHGVHDWSSLRGYLTRGDASGDPQQISERQEAARVAFESSPMAFVDTWKSPVLLIHGDDDRNVEFSQTLVLAEALRRRGVPFEQLIFPNEIHDFLLHRHWVEAYQATADFFARKLRPPSVQSRTSSDSAP